MTSTICNVNVAGFFSKTTEILHMERERKKFFFWKVYADDDDDRYIHFETT